MIYSYSETGVIATQAGTVSAIVDTDSPDFVRRVQWIREKTGLAEPSILKITAQSPGDPTPNTTGILTWERDGKTFGTDCFLTLRNPEVSLASICLELNIVVPNLEHQRYVEVAPPAASNDWDAPGAPFGAPIEETKTWYQTRFQGQPDGFVWTAPSGNRYRHERRGTGLFGYPAWKKL